MQSLKYYSDAILGATPGQLTDILIELTTDYAEVCDMLIPIERAKMKFWLENKKLESEKPVSDKTVEMMWMAEPNETLNGMMEKRSEMYRKAVERIMSNVKAIIRHKEAEARNIT